MEDRVKIDVSDRIAEVMLDRAAKFNALDLRMFAALSEAADHLSSLSGVRAVVLHGAGENFCAGIDLSLLAGSDIDIPGELARPRAPSPANLFQRAAYAWRELPVPVIAALDGVTFGGGFQIAMGADVRFASPATRFSILESKWGLVPDMGITVTLRDILPPDRVKELSWTAREFGADEARGLGLVTEVCDAPLEAARTLAKACAARSPDAIRGIKRLVNDAWQLADTESLAMEARLQAGVIGGPNQREAMQANLEKRAPRFED